MLKGNLRFLQDDMPLEEHVYIHMRSSIINEPVIATLPEMAEGVYDQDCPAEVR